MSTAAEWPNMYSGAQITPLRDNDGLRESVVDHAEFWHARPELRSIFDNSRRLLTAPWAMLGGALIRCLHSIPWWVSYQSSMGTASLNAMLILVGDSGGGKSVLSRQLDHCVPFVGSFPPKFNLIEAGSGEAIAEMYAHHAEKDDHEQGIRRGDLIWHSQTRSNMFGFDEIGRMFKVGQRDGSTIYEYIKSGWSGSQLGRRLVGMRGVLLPSDSYRMTVIANAQPTRCGPLFTEDEIAGGFPGRMIWLQTQDPTLIHVQDDSQVDPWMVAPLDWGRVPVIHALPEMNEVHRQDRLRYHTKGRGPLEGHEVMLRVKIAVALMRLAGRFELSHSDWDLSQYVLDESIRTRTEIQQSLVNEQLRSDRERGQAAARSAAAAEEATEAMRLKRIADRLREFRIQGMPENLWRRNLRSTDRAFYEDALCFLIQSGT